MQTNIINKIKQWGMELGFQQIGITDTNLSQYESTFRLWLEKKFQGTMEYMAKQADLRLHPAKLHTGTIRILSARMDYLPPNTDIFSTLNHPHKAYVSRYALGRDYHKLIRKRLSLLARKLEAEVNDHRYRAFCDSAPVLEKPLAEKAGLGWIGKHTNLIHPKAGSWFFLGEIYTNIPLPIDEPQQKSHCGSCTACIDVCPTKAIIAPYQLDARRCISYLTIELRDTIPLEFRPLIGNRIYGCDDCQLVCPWNKFAKTTGEKDFYPRHELHASTLLQLFAWTEKEFLEKTAGSAIRRIGYACWLRNIAIALGNAPKDTSILAALYAKLPTVNSMVGEHITWAIDRHTASESER